MAVFNNVLELIGNTPVVRINHLDTGPCELFIKLESQNPGASIKDRIGLKMVEDAERAVDQAGRDLVEGTAGNTGWALLWWRRKKVIACYWSFRTR
jgi:cystathionine beta-synthase